MKGRGLDAHCSNCSPPVLCIHSTQHFNKSQIAKLNFEQGLSSIILVPEISLTSQIIDDFMQEFKDHIIVTHSRQTESERHLSWKKALESNTPKIIIGPRSALFLPIKKIKKIGAIIVDEFHEPSYKQDKQN